MLAGDQEFDNHHVQNTDTKQYHNTIVLTKYFCVSILNLDGKVFSPTKQDI
jgi:hypothetical protein